MTTMQQRIEFDPRNRKQTDEAKTKYIAAKADGRSVLHPESGARIERWADVRDGFVVAEPETQPHELALRILDDTGDQRIVWDLRDKKQIEEAKRKFDELVSKGWKPYAIDRNGNKGRRIYAFDAVKEELIFDDKTTKVKLKDFASKFKRVEVLPKTTPG